jgi:hypothetical protein
MCAQFNTNEVVWENEALCGIRRRTGVERRMCVMYICTMVNSQCVVLVLCCGLGAVHRVRANPG